MRVLPLRMSLLFEAVFEQLEVDLGAVARDSKIVGQAAEGSGGERRTPTTVPEVQDWL